MKLTAHEQKALRPRKRQQGPKVYGPTLKDVAFITGMNYWTLIYRVRDRNMPMAQAVREPIMSFSAAGTLGKRVQMETRKK